jgi:hypothetical protein
MLINVKFKLIKRLNQLTKDKPKLIKFKFKLNLN